MTNSITEISFDDFLETTPIGSIERAIGNNLYGINHQQIPSVVPSNKDTYGFTFFTRPQLNLQPDNLRSERLFYPLLTSDPMTIQRYVRCTLDPRQITGYKYGRSGNDFHNIPQISCPLVDNENPFISVLTNNITALSGWPDMTLSTRSSEPGLYRESQTIPDGIVKIYETFDLDATFRNTKGDPIIFMISTWMHYMAGVFEGNLAPYIDFIAENELDFNTRIYRLVLDKNKEKVVKIAATGASIPVSVPTGSFFDYNVEQPYNLQNKDFTIRFKCDGAIYNDDILIYYFNKTVGVFNSSMREDKITRTMIKVPKSLQGLFKNRCYPRIDPNTYELEWWVNKELFNQKTSSFLSTFVGAQDDV